MISRFLASLAFATTLGAATLAPAVALADPVADAKDLFTRGRELRTHGDCASAVPLFRKALELYPAGLGSGRNLAECEEQLGHFASARRAWLDLKRALLTESDKKYEGWSKDADDAAARLAPKLASLTVDVNFVGPGGEAVSGEGTTVTLDGETLPSTLLGTTLERDPGRHVVRVSGARVTQAGEKAVDLKAGEARRIALRVVVTPKGGTDPEVPPAPQAASLPAVPPDDVDERSRATKRTFAWVAIGVGAASVVGAGISFGVRQSAESTLDKQCPTHDGCSSTLHSTVSTGQAASTAVTVFSILGLVGVTSGIVLLATSEKHGGSQARLVLTPTLGGAQASWTF